MKKSQFHKDRTEKKTPTHLRKMTSRRWRAPDWRAQRKSQPRQGGRWMLQKEGRGPSTEPGERLRTETAPGPQGGRTSLLRRTNLSDNTLLMKGLLFFKFDRLNCNLEFSTWSNYRPRVQQHFQANEGWKHTLFQEATTGCAIAKEEVNYGGRWWRDTCQRDRNQEGGHSSARMAWAVPAAQRQPARGGEKRLSEGENGTWGWPSTLRYVENNVNRYLTVY